MFDRDSLDLMDDLLHETGHHYLNTYLNHVELINEDEDIIYYSPWRNALRPVRGIYHATFTFYWALELFHCLILADEKKKLVLTKEEKVKIRRRFLEEFYMLESCWPDLNHAYKNKKINKAGFELISDIYKQIQEMKKVVVETEKTLSNLSGIAMESIVDLKLQLKNSRSDYSL
jgi:hypothetical protein